MCFGDTIKIGDQVPNMPFKVFHENDEKEMSISDFKGKWLILFFYPADFTFVCPTELEEMADNYEKFKKEGAEVVSVSTDTVFAHKAWHDMSDSIKKIKFPMASDANHKLSELFGVLIKDEGLALRGSFIINPDGALKALEINDNSIGRNAKELLRKLQAAKFVHEHGDKVCPASWTPGSDTLEPGMDLVGKI
ncbi:MAG: redoxin domain-containing protein [Patescibacteria group bacterium]